MKNHKKFFKKTKLLPIDEFFQKILYEKKIGYYNTFDPFGKDGDYITAPKNSNLFSEMIAIWIISIWENFDKPKVCENCLGKRCYLCDRRGPYKFYDERPKCWGDGAIKIDKKK